MLHLLRCQFSEYYKSININYLLYLLLHTVEGNQPKESPLHHRPKKDNGRYKAV